jgi:nitrogen regulatory protein PII
MLGMKRIEAIIRPHKQGLVLAALAKLGINNVTVIEIMGLVHHISFSRTYQPVCPDEETQTGLIPKRLLLLFVEDEQVQPVIELIQSVGFTGDQGDGKIAISPLDQLVRIRPKGDSAPAG